MRINKNRLMDRRGKWDVCLFLVVCAIVFYPKFAFAGASITVSSGSWAMGTQKTSFTSTKSGITVTNAASGGTEDITISVANSVSAGWQPAAAAGPNQFVLRMTDVNGQVITATPYTLFTGLTNNATSSAFTLYFMTPASVTAGEGTQQTITVTLTATNWVYVWGCGDNLVVTHTAGTVAPVNKTVTYNTVSTPLGGTGTKCWITQNLGATTIATSVTDNSEANAGWCWQFNRAQGFKHDGTTRTPSTTWNSTNDNSSATWETTKDPCTLLLGTGWRLPTCNEWNNADTTGGWTTMAIAYDSIFKIHTSGYLNITDGSLGSRGVSSFRWARDQADASNGYALWGNASQDPQTTSYEKGYGLGVRCLKD